MAMPAGSGSTTRAARVVIVPAYYVSMYASEQAMLTTAVCLAMTAVHEDLADGWRYSARTSAGLLVVFYLERQLNRGYRLALSD